MSAPKEPPTLNDRIFGSCPLCGRAILHDGNDKLNAYYYPPRDWWVIEHLINENGAWRQTCCRAGYQLYQ